MHQLITINEKHSELFSTLNQAFGIRHKYINGVRDMLLSAHWRLKGLMISKPLFLLLECMVRNAGLRLSVSL